ncbi:MAG: glycosyltransferase family 25 protein [Alphaproteobacteria bacterium]|nr:glycosyltransferase family 25 protein [Alphaproteobacteria bacterium]
MIQLQKVLVVSLDEDSARRDHIRRHLPAIGLHDFEFVSAVDHRSQLVEKLYRQEKVHRYPGCFRCGQTKCPCANNILIPQQVANWLSFKKVWSMCAHHPEAFFLVCEDDVSFRKSSNFVLMSFLETFDPGEKNVLVRMAASGKDPKGLVEGKSYTLSDRVVMSNAAYILNGHMARFLLNEFDRIETTSDIWLHRDIAGKPEVQSLTIEPLLATDLSFSPEFAQFTSRIHPKGIDEQDLKRQRTHIKRVTNAAEYDRVRQSWFGS